MQGLTSRCGFTCSTYAVQSSPGNYPCAGENDSMRIWWWSHTIPFPATLASGDLIARFLYARFFRSCRSPRAAGKSEY